MDFSIRVFMSVYIEKYMIWAQELSIYMRVIRLAAMRSDNWATYDEQLRLKKKRMKIYHGETYMYTVNID